MKEVNCFSYYNLIIGMLIRMRFNDTYIILTWRKLK